MSGQWQIDIISPNGTKSNLVVDGDTDDAALRDFFENALASHREHDHAPIEGTQGIAAADQPLKQAVSGKRK